VQLVLHNLLDNAVKYSPRGSRIDVALRADDCEAVLSVRDQGTGMDQEALANAFTPFWRGTDTATGGTGLGLHLVRELVHAHGGTVAVQSTGPGQGSEFTVRLPRRGASA
jgi:signal transduction histidine kinase